MRTLTLDFQDTRTGRTWFDAALLVLGLTIAALLGVESMTVQSGINALEEQQAIARHDSNPVASRATLSPLELQRLRAEMKQANEVLAQLALPWDALFKDIEASPRIQVALLSIEPDAKKHLIKITGEAKDLDAMLGYVQALQKGRSLTGVYLQSHHIDERSAEKPVRFVVVASWVIRP